MRCVRKFLEFLGVVFLATLAHEAYHASAGTVHEVGIRFGEGGGFFVGGADLPGETGAYIVTGLVLVLGLLVSILGDRKR